MDSASVRLHIMKARNHFLANGVRDVCLHRERARMLLFWKSWGFLPGAFHKAPAALNPSLGAPERGRKTARKPRPRCVPNRGSRRDRTDRPGGRRSPGPLIPPLLGQMLLDTLLPAVLEY